VRAPLCPRSIAIAAAGREALPYWSLHWPRSRVMRRKQTVRPTSAPVPFVNDTSPHLWHKAERKGHDAVILGLVRMR
jgi:hypothetical protein